jgi:hypothetical protein
LVNFETAHAFIYTKNRHALIYDILGRLGEADEGTIEFLQNLESSDAPMVARGAAALALIRLHPGASWQSRFALWAVGSRAIMQLDY